MAKLFVSYSRKDSVAARKLIEAFQSVIGQDVWVDWESIPPAVDWLEQIFRGIEEADAFIFMVSPDSIASEVCNVEIGRAALNNKRIIPIVLRDVNPKDANEIIRRLNWTFIREGDNFEEGLAKVKTAIELDLDWLEEHRRLQVRALEWHRRKDVSLLLRGRDLRNAEHMLKTYTSKDPTPTDLQRKYIEHSRKTETNRLIAMISAGVAIVALAILSYMAIRASNIARASEAEARRQQAEALKQKGIAEANADLAEHNRQIADQNAQNALNQKMRAEENALLAEAQRSAARAQIYQIRTGELYTSTLLALDSWEKSPSPEAEEVLRENISLLPLPVSQDSQKGNIKTLALSPDGNTFLAASEDGTICVRSVKDGVRVFCTNTPTALNDAVFVLGGKYVATGEESGSVKLLNSQSGKVEREIPSSSPVRDLDTSPGGKQLAIAHQSGEIIIVNLEKQNDKGYSLTLSGTLTVAAFSPDGRWVAAGSDKGLVTIWNLNGGQIISGARHKGAVLTLRFSPNSRFLITGGTDNYAAGFDIKENKEVLSLPHSDWVRDIAFAPDNSWLATASDDGRVRVWDLFSGKERLVMFQDAAVLNVRISADGKWIAATGDDRTVRVWSAYTGAEMFEIPLKSSCSELLFSQDNQRLASGEENGTLSVWDVSGMIAPLSYIQLNDLALTSTFSATGSTLFAADAKQVWSLNSHSLPANGSRPSGTTAYATIYDITHLAASPDSQTLGVATSKNEYIIYNLKTQVPVRVKPSGPVNAIAFSSDGLRFITGAQDGNIQTWEVKSGKLLSTVQVGDPVRSLAVGPSGIVAGLMDKLVILDTNAEKKITEWDSPGDNQFVAFNADGSLVAVANSSGQIEIWGPEDSGYTLQKTVTHEQPYSMAFRPQGDLLAVGTSENIYLINARTGEEVRRIAQKGTVSSVSFSADGKTLASASLKTIQLWDVSQLQATPVGDLVQAACSRLISNFSHSEWQVFFGSDQKYVKLCDNLPVPE